MGIDEKPIDFRAAYEAFKMCQPSFFPDGVYEAVCTALLMAPTKSKGQPVDCAESRHKFESWATAEAYDVSPKGDDYYDFDTNTAWKSWQAAWNTRPERESGWVRVSDGLPENEETVLVWRDLSKSRPGATWQGYGLERFYAETACLNPRFGITDIKLPTFDIVAWRRISPFTQDDNTRRG